MSHNVHDNNLRRVLLQLLAIFIGWLVLVSGMHYWLNFDHDKRRVIKMGYMPVITNMAAPLLDKASEGAEDVRFRALKYASFAEMAESLRNGQIDAGFMIAPLSIVLRQQGEDMKVVYIGNRHESTLVTRKDLNIKSITQLSGKTLAVPMRYSGHNIAALQLLEENGLLNDVDVVEMNPPDMAAALASGSLESYFVGEPFAAQTVLSGDSEVLYYVEELWPNFMCNLLVVRGDLIESDPELVQMMVESAVRSGVWADAHKEEAAKISAKYWNQRLDIVTYAMNTPPDRILYDKYMPVEEDFQLMADRMKHFGLLESADISGLVDDEFAKAADTSGLTDDVSSIIRN